ncbi:MAG: hypothetical protein ACPL7I_10830, partial [Myxococcota bacterium]
MKYPTILLVIFIIFSCNSSTIIKSDAGDITDTYNPGDIYSNIDSGRGDVEREEFWDQKSRIEIKGD